MATRGRPKEAEAKPVLKYKQVFTNSEGVKTIWHWDKTKFPNGPIKVETQFPQGWESETQKVEKQNKKLPKTKRKYFNPSNGKMVGYARAKSLGLI